MKRMGTENGIFLCGMKRVLAFLKGQWLFPFALVGFGGTFWLVSERFIDAEVSPKIYFALFGAAAFCLLHALELFRKGAPPPSRFANVATALVACAVSQSVYALLQWGGLCASPRAFPVCGSFDNPAGVASALAFSLPFGLWMADGRNPLARKMGWVATVVMALAVMASDSRSGILAAAAVLSAYFVKGRRKARKPWMVAMVAGWVAAAVFLYFHKKDSADGRLLIWQCTWSLIQESPWTGHGAGGFRAGYMDAQADYFAEHPGSPYALLADNTQAPFNEYLGLLADYGLAGGMALLAAIALLFRAWRRHPSGSSRPAMLCLLSVAIFSLFSYPFRYAHTWVLCGLSVAVLLSNAWMPSWRLRRATAWVAALCLVAASVFAFRQMKAEMRWCEVAGRSLGGMTDEMLPAYRNLYARLSHNPFFLYNYVAELNVAGHYAESLRIGLECDTLMADYFVQLLLADNYKRQGKYDEAEHRLRQASRMCPARFVPPHELFLLYEAQCDTAGMHRMAEAILRKPVKVETPEVRRIVAEMERFRRMAMEQVCSTVGE